jgi:hypothetical protein
VGAETKVETTAETILPEAGQQLTDARGRKLLVQSVNVGDPLGREVVGTIVNPPAPTRDYSTSLAIWKTVWLDKRPEREREPGDLG